MPIFENLELMKQALTHRSFLHEHHLPLQQSNERLEFLGDAILELWVRHQLYERYPEFCEGDLSIIRSRIVCRSCLAQIARSIDLGKYLLLSSGEEKSGGRDNDTLLANAFESLTAALYLDQDYTAVNAWLMAIMTTVLINIADQKRFKDTKTIFQEMVQEFYHELPTYHLLSEKDTETGKVFSVAVKIQGKQVSKGSGKTRQKAEMEASRKAIAILKKRQMVLDH